MQSLLSSLRGSERTLFLLYSSLWFFLFLLFPIWATIPLMPYRLFFFLFCLILFGVGFYFLLRIVRFEFDPRFSVKEPFQYRKILLFFLLLAFLLQLPALFFPITAYTDEISFIAYGIYSYEFVHHATGHFFPYLLWGLRIFVALLVVFLFAFRKNLHSFTEKVFSFFTPRRLVFSALALLLFLFVYFFAISSSLYGFAENFYAYKNVAEKVYRLSGGLLALLSSLQVFLFGHQEAGVRFLSFLFYLLSPYYFYKLVALLRNEKEALFAGLLMLFAPGFFYAGHLAYNGTTELVFIAVISTYCFARYKLQEQNSYLYLFFFWLAAGFLYERKAFLFFLSFLFYLAVDFLFFTEKKLSLFLQKYKPYLFGIVLYLISVAPYVLLRLLGIFNIGIVKANDYQFLFSNLFSSQLLDYALVAHYLVSVPALIVLLPSIVYALWLTIARKSWFNLYLLSFLLVHYVFFTIMNFVSIPRLLMPLLLAFSFWIAQFLGFFKTLLPALRKLLYLSFSLLVVYLILLNSFFTYSSWEERYLPMNEMFSFISTSLPPHTKILKTLPPSPYNFYIAKYGLSFEDFDPTTWKEPASSQTIQNLHTYAVEHNISYVLFPLPQPSYDSYFSFKPNQGNATWLDTLSVKKNGVVPQVNHDVVLKLYAMETGPFSKAAEFHLGKNVLFLSKVDANYSF
ncbi:glycosyltransferase family 39 protein [Candidatus Woesearchaeota archaeon]|nr:glycosyltransferase family 39 protein [Candidatus Woesearchaeota archaeon]